MNNDPAVLLYTSDFLTGVLDLNMEERGQYITLLCVQHQKGHLKEETIRLLVGSVSDNVLKKFIKDENGYYYNPRMDIEKEKRNKFSNSRKENGKKGGRPKKALAKPNGYPKDKPKNNLPENENDNENIILYFNNLKELINYIQDNLNYKLNNTPIELNTLNYWIDNKIPKDVIKYGFEEARRRNISNINYIQKMVINRVEELKKTNENASSSVPDWLDKPIEKDEEGLEELEEIFEEFN